MPKTRKTRKTSPNDNKLLATVEKAIANASKGGSMRSSMRSTMRSTSPSSPSSPSKKSMRPKPRSRLATFAKRVLMATVLAGFIYLLVKGASFETVQQFAAQHSAPLMNSIKGAQDYAGTKYSEFFDSLRAFLESGGPSNFEGLKKQASDLFTGSYKSIFKFFYRETPSAPYESFERFNKANPNFKINPTYFN